MKNSSNMQITSVTAREILDSRGNPTVETTVVLSDGTKGVASVPSGASTGSHEAHEKRDTQNLRYGGKGVLGAINGIRDEISPALVGRYAFEQDVIDHTLIELDGTNNKERLGANATLSVSLAVSRAAAISQGDELYQYLGGATAQRLPVPMLNIMNGGAHASNNLEIQEFMIVPKGLKTLTESVRAASEVYHTLGKILNKNGYSTCVGDEGGFAPNLKSDEEAIELICEAIDAAGYSTSEIQIALDVASSEWCTDDGYFLPKGQKTMRAAELIDYYAQLCNRYPICSIEDGLGEDDFVGFAELTNRLGDKIMLVGDDLFVTNEKRLSNGIKSGIANSILIKPNQIGTLTETLNVIRLASEHNYNYIISHRSGETEDTFIADLAVATNAPYIKAGAPCRTDRTAKYNRLMAIEDILGCNAVYKQ